MLTLKLICYKYVPYQWTDFHNAFTSSNFTEMTKNKKQYACTIVKLPFS